MTVAPFITLGARLIANGYQIIPIPLGSKGPHLPEWRSLTLTPETFTDFTTGTHEGKHGTRPNVPGGAGIGIVSTWTPAIDIDVYDDDLAAAMETFVRDNVDDAPIRVGQAPKRLLMYRTAEPFAKVTSASYKAPGASKPSRIEVLGSGQQYVAYHTHPDTRRPYLWTDDFNEPLCVRVDDLPLITEAHARAVCREFERAAEALGWTKVSEAATEGAGEVDALAVEMPPAETRDETDRVRDALKHVSADCDRETYLRVLAALRWTGWLCAEEIALEWAQRSETKFDEHDFTRDWRSLKRDRGGRTTTLGTVYHHAKEAGWDASRAAADTSLRFDELMTMIASIDPSERVKVKTLLTDIATSKLDAVDAAEIRAAFCKAFKLPIRDYNRAVREAVKVDPRDHDEATHAKYARQLSAKLEASSGEEVVAVEGRIWTYDRNFRIWSGRTPTEFEVDVASQFDGMENCSRRNDYLAIANHLHSMASIDNDDFFEKAPRGLAAVDRFYTVVAGAIKREPLTAAHRARTVAPRSPKVMPTPLWDSLMSTAFAGDRDQEQEHLLEEFIGACLVGAAPDYEKVLFMYGKSRSGKGTILKIVNAMFDRGARTSVSPDKWGREYYLADLAGKRVNLVGELSDEEVIDANAFKNVIGRDELTARHPTHRPFQFRNEAGHIFQGNHFIPTRETSDAFFSRWMLMEFRNSMLESGKDINVNLAQDIIDAELPGVMARCLKGARRLMERGSFLMTPQHVMLMAKWRKRSSSLMEFIGDSDVCVLGEFPRVTLQRAALYEAYVNYCKVSSRKPIGRNKFYDEINTSPDVARLRVRFARQPGDLYLVRGLALRGQVFQAEINQSLIDDL